MKEDIDGLVAGMLSMAPAVLDVHGDHAPKAARRAMDSTPRR
jgi:hypothetical protein